MTNYQIKIMPVPPATIKYHPPKYTIRLKELDEEGRYVKFAKQDPVLIKKLQDQLDGLILEV